MKMYDHDKNQVKTVATASILCNRIIEIEIVEIKIVEIKSDSLILSCSGTTVKENSREYKNINEN
jgi:hypothetical protein